MPPLTMTNPTKTNYVVKNIHSYCMTIPTPYKFNVIFFVTFTVLISSNDECPKADLAFDKNQIDHIVVNGMWRRTL